MQPISIYIYENMLNGKIYIGQTDDLHTRDLEHIRGRSYMHIDSAIKKYGRNNFLLNIITVVDSREQANYAEMDWIARARNLLGEENVYNITDGGDFGFSWNGKNHSEETKIKMSVVAKERIRNKPFTIPSSKGKALSDEHKLKLSAVNKGKTWKLVDGKRVWMEK